uniref:Glycosyltransferase n=1 Tax=Nemophila menziesii TaxID=79376 RepID=A0A292GEP7_NEMME|nr:flavone 4'-O-glucoside 7-glucosyltransferase [Nemophila menziesii]
MECKNPDSLHVFLVSAPGQGNVTPMLRLAKSLASKGLLVTFSTPESYGKEMRKTNDDISDQPILIGEGSIRFEFLDDEWDENEHKGEGLDAYATHLERVGKQNLPRMFKKHEEEGRPISCIINNPFIPWVPEVAESLGIPSALLWVQSCASFSSYYHFFNDLVSFPTESNLKKDVCLPSMPMLKYDEVPLLLYPIVPLPIISLKNAMLRQQKNLSKTFCVLVDTFQQLEDELIHYLSKLCPIRPIGPLFKISDTSSSNISGDIRKADDCIEWLDSKSPSSVVYISFGSIVHLKQEQITEIAYALMNINISFLWVMKPPQKDSYDKQHVLPQGFLEKVGEKGKVVKWSPQEQVLSHQSLACFVTHCGWNSSMEALANGIRVVTLPQWGDQVTNAKFLVDVFGVGVRLSRGDLEDRIIPREEIELRLLEVTSGEKATEMKHNALRWKKAAEEAVAKDGSSSKNLQEFVDELNNFRFIT